MENKEKKFITRMTVKVPVKILEKKVSEKTGKTFYRASVLGAKVTLFSYDELEVGETYEKIIEINGSDVVARVLG